MKAIRDVYGETLAKLGEKNKNIVVLDADVSSSTKSSIFGNQHKERFYNMGVSEANMLGAAAGLSTMGKIPFVNTFAVFMINRGADVIRNSICYSNLNVKIAGAYSGMSDSYDGATHHSFEDIAYMRAIPNMTIFSVCDEKQTEKIVEKAIEINGPVYLRLSRAAMPNLYDANEEFEVGKGKIVKEGNDLTIISTGYLVHKALEAAKELEEENISVRVVDMYSIKPIDKELIVKCAKETKKIVTLEEHSIIGGLGSSVSEVLIEEYPVPMKILGIRDTFTESGDYEELINKYGLGKNTVKNTIKDFIKIKR
ncbi:transketolase family protein [uncultured Cetobacterium sp.]|uniref:transketolase family protein n=1 Tax=uncultured Cetobacterium sp. TaxID=527638 RepID=UPI00261CA821|nr:transketolase family protein [uncultured Cetobacterium sp.]